MSCISTAKIKKKSRRKVIFQPVKTTVSSYVLPVTIESDKQFFFPLMLFDSFDLKGNFMLLVRDFGGV